ncbi:MAG: hypothetical protein ABSH38_09905 [Verrucomicrobiota bacterium]|jgi:hypothetical protein
MNNCRCQIAAGLAALFVAVAPGRAQPAAQALADSLVFRNGDVLYGKLLAIQPRSVVRWQHPDAAEPIDFSPESIAQIDFPAHKALASPANDSCRITCANGDALNGSLVAGDRDTVTLETWYAGKLKLPRKALQSVVFTPRAPVFFAGIEGLEGWTQGNAVKAFAGEAGEWTYRNGAFYADKPASIARDLKLPDVAEIQFDLAWKGMLNLAIAFYTDSLQPILLTAKDDGPDFGGFYSLRFNSTVFISLMPIRKKEPLRSLGDVIVPSLNQKDRVHVDLRVSKPDHRLVLFFDGTLVKEWNDPGGFVGAGTGVRFVQNVGSAIKLGNLRVAQWNGVLDEGAAAPPDGSRDTVSLESGVKITGDIEAIADGQLSVHTTSGTVEVPLAKATGIEFARLAGEPFKSAANTVHATFVQGGAVTMELLSWRPDAVVVASPDFGKASFDPAAFSRLKFLSVEPKS